MSTPQERIAWLAELSRQRRRERAVVRASAIGKTPEFRPKAGQCSSKLRKAKMLARLQGGCCYLCWNSFEAMRLTPTIEHVVPKSRGGANRGNLLAACEPCNVKKGSRAPHPCELILLAAINRRMLFSGKRRSPPSEADCPAQS
jgi:5-methylcytosine-specific restriction endonuclease McrA